MLQKTPPSILSALRFIQEPVYDRFDALALEIFEFQMAANEPYRRYCAHRGQSSPKTWSDIPPLPARAFKEFDLWTAGPVRTFVTSGTTQGAEKRGRHGLPSLDLYASAWEPAFKDHVLPDRERIRILSLIPSETELPDSSLSYMAARILERFGTPESRVAVRRDGLEFETIGEAMRASKPLLILGTALAMAALLESLPSSIQLPKGSRIMDTGGFKGRARETERRTLLDYYQKRLGIAPERVVGEYGMTELSSQFYETQLSKPRRRFVGPAWVRTRAIDPETLRPLPFGQRGLLAHWDLANAWTVLGVLTEDVGVVHEDGFELEGRAPGSELRGCSLVTEELLDGR
jgi:acyl-protein synthetase LuxE